MATEASRVGRLREELARRDLAGFLIPRSDRYQGEYVAACDERLAFATGFTGSAGLAAVLIDRAAVFVDGRYELQAAAEVDAEIFEIVALKDVKPSDWLAAALPKSGALGVDPWLHTPDEIERLETALEAVDAQLVRLADNPLDALWTDRPAPPATPARLHPIAYAGESAADKRGRLAEHISRDGFDAAFLGAPESVCWLLNLRADDVPHVPVLRAQALLHSDGRVVVFANPAQFDDEVRTALGPDVEIAADEELTPALSALKGKRVALDRRGAPEAVAARLKAAEAEVDWRLDVTAKPKARKNAAEIAGARTAQRRDGAALSTFLAWIDREAPKGDLDELAISDKLRETRAAVGDRLGYPLLDLSFDAIVGFGPNGAIVHYRVDAASNRPVRGDGVLLLDSGGQYRDGTTDVTRTIAIGAPPAEAMDPFTRVLQGMIAISTLRFPPKIAGRDIEAFARARLWEVGFDFDHGVGHGVGSYLSVHEGPAGLSRRSGAALEEGMILSNEPGYYRTGAFGIRIENLVLVRPAETPEGGDRPMHSFETLTLAPIDRRLINPGLLTPAERVWLDAYHARVLEEIEPLVDAETAAWLRVACAPL